MSRAMTIPDVTVDENGRIALCCVGKDRQWHQIDLTTEIERVAKEAVAEHMRKYHGHQI